MKNSFLRLQDSVANRVAVFFLLCCWGTQFACQSRTTSIKDDLQSYLEQAKQWTAAEEQIHQAVVTVQRDEFVHDDLVTATLKPMIDVSHDHVLALEQYRPQTPPLLNVHREYIEAWRALSLSIALIIDAMTKKDYILLAKAKKDLSEAQQLRSSALSNLARLFREAGLWKESPAELTSPTENH